MRQSGAAVRVLLADDKLGYATAGLHGGGRMMMAWTRALLDRGVEVLPVILRSSPELRALVDVEGLPFTFLDRREYDPRTVADLVGLVRQHRIQVLHVQGYGAGTFGRMAGALTGVPSVFHVHADYRLSPKGYPAHVRAVDRLLAPFTRHVFAVSEATRRFAVEVQGFRAEQVEVLRNPVDRSRFRAPTPDERAGARAHLGVPPSARVVITVGRLDRLKGVDVQVAAWERIAAAVPDALLLVVGDGPERQALERGAAGTSAGSGIRFLGSRPDVEHLLRAADVAVLSSRMEGLGLVLLEAMSTGVPVVGTRVGGIPEIVSDGENGLLVPPEDPRALSEAVIRVLTDRELHGRLAAAAAKAAQLYGLDRAGERLENTYRNLIGTHAR